jgi:hypothetical protein
MKWRLVAIGMAFIAIIISVSCAVLASQYEGRIHKLERANLELTETNDQQTSILSGLVEIQGGQGSVMKSMIKSQQELVKTFSKNQDAGTTYVPVP